MEQIMNTIGQAQSNLQSLGIPCAADVSYKEVDGSVFQVVTLTVKGSEVYKNTVAISDSPEDFKQKTIEAKTKQDEAYAEAVAKAEDMIAVADAAISKKPKK